MSTILDVAKLAKVSTATVSNHLNGTRPVSPEKRERIDKAIEALRYLPNASAQNLRGRPCGEVCVVLPNLHNPYYLQCLQGIESYLQRYAMTVSFSVSNDRADIEEMMLRRFVKRHPAGMVVFPCRTNDADFYRTNVLAFDVPLTLVDRRVAGLDEADFFGFDNHDALYRLTKRYLSRGLRRIALLAGDADFSCESDAESGYRQAMSESGGAPEDAYVSRQVNSKEGAFSETVRLCAKMTPEVILTTASSNLQGITAALSFFPSVSGKVELASLGVDTWTENARHTSVFVTRRQAISMGTRIASSIRARCVSAGGKKRQCALIKDEFDAAHTRAHSPEGGRHAEREPIHILLLQNEQLSLFANLLPSFTAETGIRTSVRTVSYADYLDAIADCRQSGTMPDVFMVDMPWLYSFAVDGMLADLQSRVADAAFRPDTYLPNCFRYLSEYNGKYYGLPFISVPQILYYRKDLFENRAIRNGFEKRFQNKLRPPRTWREFFTVGDYFTRSLNPESPVRYGATVSAAYPACLSPLIHVFMRGCKSRIYDERFRVCFDSAQTIEAFRNLGRLLDNGDADSFSKDNEAVVRDFVNGESAMLITFQSILSSAQSTSLNMTNQVGYAPIPGNNSILGGWSLCIAADSRRQDDSFAFINWACGERIANYMAVLTGQSAVKEIFENDELVSLYPWLKTYREIYGRARAIIPPFAPGKSIIPQGEIDRILYALVYDIVENREDIAASVHIAQETFARLFTRYGYTQE